MSPKYFGFAISLLTKGIMKLWQVSYLLKIPHVVKRQASVRKVWKVWNDSLADCLCGHQRSSRFVWGFFFTSFYFRKWGNYIQNLFQRLSLKSWSQAWKIENEAPCFILISQCMVLCDLLHWRIVNFLWGFSHFWTVYNDHMRDYCFFFFFLVFQNFFEQFYRLKKVFS